MTFVVNDGRKQKDEACFSCNSSPMTRDEFLKQLHLYGNR